MAGMQEQAAAQGAPQGGEEQGGGPPSIDRMVVSVDQALSQLTQVIGQADPGAGEKLAALNEQYRQVITEMVQNAQGGGGAAQGGAEQPISAQGGQGGVPAQF